MQYSHYIYVNDWIDNDNNIQRVFVLPKLRTTFSAVLRTIKYSKFFVVIKETCSLGVIDKIEYTAIIAVQQVVALKDGRNESSEKNAENRFSHVSVGIKSYSAMRARVYISTV